VTTLAELLPDVEATARLLRGVGYLPDAGLSTALLEAATEHGAIPMRGHAESLNVAAAAAISLFECVRQLTANPAQ
jgi:tRNA(Leu) C34 or U34 (ribose-2'-O)-methylase TrmL